MSKSQIKNIKELKAYGTTIPKSKKGSFNSILDLYQAGKFTNIKTAINLILKLSSRGAGPTKAVETINKMQEDLINEQASEILNIEGYNPSEHTQKRTRNERIVNISTKASKEEEVANRPRKGTGTHWTKSALQGSFREITIDDDFKSEDDSKIFNEEHMRTTINQHLVKAWKANNDGTTRTNLVSNLVIEFFMTKKEDDEDKEKKFFHHSEVSQRLQSVNQIDQWVVDQIDHFKAKFNSSDWMTGSGWVFKSIDTLTIQFSKVKQTRAGSYIPTPEVLARKHAIVNIKNTDDRCVKYAIIAYLNYDTLPLTKSGKEVKDKNEVRHYSQFWNTVKEPEGITYPINIQTDIKRFEKENNMKINVFHYDAKDEKFENLLTLYNTQERNVNVCNLLLLTDKEGKEHITWIRSINKLMFKVDYNGCRMYPCTQCLCEAFESEEKLQEHQVLCMRHEAIHCILPRKYDPTEVDDDGKPLKQEDQIKFKNYGNTFKHPFSATLDFESTLERLTSQTTTQEEDSEGNQEGTTKYQKHICNSVGIKFNSIHDQYSEDEVIFNNQDPEALLESMVIKLEEYAVKCYSLIKQNEKLDYKKMSKEIRNKHFDSKHCTDCKVEFNGETKRVMHHDHITGEYISTLCSPCNLKYKYKLFLPVNIHNLKGYDAHFIVPALNKYGYKNPEDDLISAIPSNEEKYISFSKKVKVGEYNKKNKETGLMETKPIYFEIRFIDTIAFMPSSLCTLIDNLKTSCKDIQELRKAFKNTSKAFPIDADFKLMISKGVYPYDYIDNYNRLHEEQLPPIEAFYSQLNNTYCKDEDYKVAQHVWTHFDCKTMLDYHNLYLRSDVLLLADVFGAFKDVCYKIYGLDASYYYTSPGLSWDAFLKHSNEKSIEDGKGEFIIELLTDMNMYLFVESSIRGGLSQISKRYAKANNKYMSSGYDASTMDSYILYLDANNLYGYAMCEYLPKSGFKWSERMDWTTESILQLDDKGEKGFLFDVDLEYPEELHDLHNGYALASENQKVKTEWLSEWQSKGYKESNIEKLITSFFEKKNYGINYRLLKLFLALGLKLKKVNRVLEFDQEPFMKSYIMKNTAERAKKDATAFEKDFFKLMNNSVYGKTMENVRNRINFKLVSSVEKAQGTRNTLIRWTRFNDDLVGMHLCKQQVKLNKPIFIGQNVLDQSKYLMYDFHYNTMLKNFDRENIDLLFTDTDSLCYNIKKQDPFKFMKEQSEQFDLSNYPKDHHMYDSSNGKVVGKFKNESTNQIMEFVGLRSKLYAFTTDKSVDKDDDDEHKKCKGVKRSVVKQDIRFSDYKRTVMENQIMRVKQNGFRSYKHQIFTETVSKVALSFNDDKIHIKADNIHCLTFGHKNIIMK